MEKEIERILEWLKQKGVYNQFIGNLEKRYYNKVNYVSLFDSYSKLVTFCSAAFIYSDAPEGADFWLRIYSEFCKNMRIYYRSKMKETYRHIETLFANFESVEYDDCTDNYPCDQKKEDILFQIESERYKIKDLENGLKQLNQ